MRINRTSASFQPQARLVSLLGDEMVSDSIVGLIELVKNSYDADADLIEISLNAAETRDATAVAVTDNGSGMTVNEVLTKYLAPATENKAVAKKKGDRTPKGRLPIGEKGVGRFAVQKIGHDFRLITRAANSHEVIVEIDWDTFDRPGAQLSDITFDVIEREPEFFTGTQTGTRLEMRRSRQLWDTRAIERLQKGLRRLRSPHVSEGKQEFDIRLTVNGAEVNLDQSDLRDRAHYSFQAIIDLSGMMDYFYESNHPGLSPRQVSKNGVDIATAARKDLTAGKPTCGPFWLNLYVWDRTPEYLKKSNISAMELDAVAGVSLFRDRLRVLPYGEPGNDWLDLDRQRINDPSRRISNNQVLGYVEIDQDTAGALRDKTNREGLMENDAFQDLRAMVRSVVRQFEMLWQQDRPIKSPPTPSETPAPQISLNRAKTVASAISATAREDIVVAVPGEVKAGNPVGLIGDVEELTQREAARMVIQQIDTAISAERQNANAREEERERLLHLAAVGLTTERFVHEFGRQALVAIQALESLNHTPCSELPMFHILEATLGALRNEFRGLSPDSGITRFQKRRDLSILEAVETAKSLNKTILSDRRHKVAVSGRDFTVFFRPASLVQIFDNLLNNAAYWSPETDDNTAAILIEVNPETRRVTIQDRGPGIPPDLHSQIFNAFATTKPSGHGMGLYIVRELLRAEGADIKLDATSAGAMFNISFPADRNGKK